MEMTNENARSVSIDQVRADVDLRPRYELDEVTLAAYIAAYQDERPMPPLVVFEDPESVLWLADGWHRLQAQQHIDRSHVMVTVHSGTRADAALYAASANLTHGLRRSQQDAVAAAKVAIRGLLLQTPGKRPTFDAVKRAARVGQQTVELAFDEMACDHEELGEKDPRGRAKFIPQSMNTQPSPAGEAPPMSSPAMGPDRTDNVSIFAQRLSTNADRPVRLPDRTDGTPVFITQYFGPSCAQSTQNALQETRKTRRTIQHALQASIGASDWEPQAVLWERIAKELRETADEIQQRFEHARADAAGVS